MVLVALTAVCLSFCLVPYGRRVEWQRLNGRMDPSIRYSRPSRPNTVDPAVWNCAHNWVITAYGNICFSPEHVSTAEMYRLRDDLEKRMAGEVNPATLRWIWARLGQTGPHGRRYIERHDPSFRQCFPPDGP